MEIIGLHNVIYTLGRNTPTGVNLLGTCFLLNKQGLFATASHVTNNDDKNLVVFITDTTDLSSYQDTSNNQGRFLTVVIIKIDPFRDICILRAETDMISNIQIGSTDDTKVCDQVGVVGYPHCVDGRNILTFQSTTVGAKVLLGSVGLLNKHFVLNIQTRPGQSGSPIFRLSDSRLVAILIGSYATGGGSFMSLGGVDPHTLHQTTHAISAEYITKMI